jgi:hypothetical protein
MLINLSLLTLQGHHAEVWCIISHGDISVQQPQRNLQVQVLLKFSLLYESSIAPYNTKKCIHS